MSTRFLLRAFALLAGALAVQVTAQAKGEVLSNLSVSKISGHKDGREALEPATAARPGDVLEYRLEYRNAGAQTARQLEATLPIPAGTELLTSGTRPQIARASLDGKLFEVMPLRRPVKKPDGGVELKLVPDTEYRAVRWQPADLHAGKSLTFVVRVRITSATTAALSAVP